MRVVARVNIVGMAVAACGLWAQPTRMAPVVQSGYRYLGAYLGLTPAQTANLLRVEAEWQTFRAEKALRIGVIESEVAQERSREMMDASALGVRVREMELICRESRARERQTMQRAREVLTAAQRTKLQALEHAYALLPTIQEADGAHLIAAPDVWPSLPIPGLVPKNLFGRSPAGDRLHPGCATPVQVGIPILGPGAEPAPNPNPRPF